MSRYLIALDEFENASDDGRHMLVYAYFGLAIYHAQVLEEVFSIMLWTDRIFKKKAKSTQEINDIIDTIEVSKKTMGNLINEVKLSYGLTINHLDILENVLNRRNFIVHKYFKIEIAKFYSDIGKKDMLRYLCDFVDDAIFIDSELKQYYDDYKLRLGFTDEKIAEITNEMKSKEQSRDAK